MIGMVDADRMLRNIAYLSILIRHSGTEDLHAAAACIARQCREAGIADVREYAFDAYVSIPVAGWLWLEGIGPVRSKVRAFGASTDGTVVEGEMVHVFSKASQLDHRFVALNDCT